MPAAKRSVFKTLPSTAAVMTMMALIMIGPGSTTGCSGGGAAQPDHPDPNPTNELGQRAFPGFIVQVQRLGSIQGHETMQLQLMPEPDSSNSVPDLAGIDISLVPLDGSSFSAAAVPIRGRPLIQKPNHWTFDAPATLPVGHGSARILVRLVDREGNIYESGLDDFRLP